jgi:MoaA/NifB/PqqE/SkfB family radical SAM enzyme
MFCTAKDGKGMYDMTTKEVLKQINELSMKGVLRLTFSGGEPTMRKDLIKLVKYAKLKGFLVEIQSNGVALSIESNVKKLINAGVDYFIISCHSHKADVYEQITQKDHFKYAIKGIKNVYNNLKECNLSISHV